jgi:hypothetical protein
VPGFSSEEIQEQIERFLTTQVESAKTKLGLRDTIAMRDSVYDLLTTSLLLRPDSFFYIVWLATNRLEGVRSLQTTDVDAILEQAGFLDFRTKPIESTTELVNAQAAVLELNAGLNSRRTGQGVRGSIGPAVDRFRKSTERFVQDELEGNVVRDGTVTETPEEIRADLTTRLSEILSRHDTIFDLVTALVEAVVRLDGVRLPETAVQGIVGRIQDRLEALQETLEGDTALAESREAMLELLVMRTILAKASNFRTPVQVVAPLAGDPTTLTLAGGGTSAVGSLTGTISAPFNYDSQTANLLRVQVGTPFTQVDITLPGGSNAALQSAALTFPFTFNAATRLRVVIDDVLQAEVDPADGPHASAAALASVLDGLYAGWTVTDSGSQLIFTSNGFGDSSSLEILGDTVARARFLGEIPLETPYNRGTGVAITDVLSAVGAGTALVRAEEVRTEYGDVSGTVSSGTPDTVDSVLASGADLIMTVNSAVVTSPSVNFELLGVQAGMALDVSAPPSVAGQYSILSVSESTLTLATVSPDTATATYEAGPDYRSVPDGARVSLSPTIDFRNAGFYRVAVSGGAVAHLTLDRSLSVAAIETVSGEATTSFLKITAASTGPLEGIATFPADAGLTALGFVASATQDQGLAANATLSGIDLLARGVRVGDLLRMTYLTTSLPEQTITAVTPTTLAFTPGVEFQAGDPTYSVVSARYEAWEVLRAALQTWLDDETQSDTTDLEFHVGRLIRGATFSQQIEDVVSDYREGLAGLTGLQTALLAYVVEEERTILNVLRTLDEQGMDRARDLLVTLELTDFFTMSKDSVSYSTHLVREMAEVTRAVTPVGRTQKSKIPGEQNIIISDTEEPYDPVGDELADN